MRAALAVTVLALAAGCMVTEEQYPHAWDPLVPPLAGADCARFAGTYADRGEAPQSHVQPSLTYGLFGHHSEWLEAARVHIAFPESGTLAITVQDADGKPLFSRTLTEKAGDFGCHDGRLVVRSRRWVAGDVMAGREAVTIQLDTAPALLVARVQERAYGTIFAVVPIAGTATHWYRFPRLAP